jgi:iron complex outermembrane receptor protein
MPDAVFSRRVSSRKYRRLFAVLLFAPYLNAQAGFVEESAERGESLFLDDIPVVLSASRLSQPINEAPAAVTVIDKQMIKDSGAWDLSEIFRLVPGMYVAYHADPYFSADSTVAYHGMVTTTTSDRMQVLIDGRSVYSGLFGGVNWSDLPIVLADIERIEVIRGPDSASYGANSYLGVINIITQHAAESRGASVSLSYGNSRSEGVFRYGAKSGDLSYRMTASIRKDDGENALIQHPTSQDKFWTLNKYDNKTMQIFNLRTDYQINASDTLEFQFGYNGGPREVGEYDNVAAVTRRAENHFEMLYWRRALESGGELSVKAFHTQERVNARLIDSDGISDGDARFSRLIWKRNTPFHRLKIPVWSGAAACATTIPMHRIIWESVITSTFTAIFLTICKDYSVIWNGESVLIWC